MYFQSYSKNTWTHKDHKPHRQMIFCRNHHSNIKQCQQCIKKNYISSFVLGYWFLSKLTWIPSSPFGNKIGSQLLFPNSWLQNLLNSWLPQSVWLSASKVDHTRRCGACFPGAVQNPRDPITLSKDDWVYNHLLSKVFRLHYHSQKVIGSLGKQLWLVLGSPADKQHMWGFVFQYLYRKFLGG